MGLETRDVPIDQQRLLQVGILGVPNAGKSTLTNALVGSKVGRSGWRDVRCTRCWHRRPALFCWTPCQPQLQHMQVSAVSPKTNTTHHCRLGAYTQGPSQVVLYDTPGIVGKE